MKTILLKSNIEMSALTKQTQELSKFFFKTIQDTVHSVMTSARSQQPAATTAPIRNTPVNNQHLHQVRIDGLPESNSNKRGEIDQNEEKN